MKEQKKLYRNPNDKVISGVISGISDYTGIDVGLLRVIAVLLAVFSTGIPVVIIYIIFALVVPLKPKNDYMRYRSNKKHSNKEKPYDIDDEYAFDPDEYKMDDEY